MKSHKKNSKQHRFKKGLENIWRQVPVDYYQRSVESNSLQKIWHYGRLKKTLEFLRDYKIINSSKRRVLDVGCASGWFISEISSYYPDSEYIGLDIYEKAINYAKKTYHGITFVYGDAHDLPFPNESFDLVICMNVLEHVVDPKIIMYEIKRVLKKDGIVIIGMDSENWLFKLAWYMWRKLDGRIWQDAHLHTLKPDKLDDLFQEAGFKVRKRIFFNLGMAILFLLTK